VPFDGVDTNQLLSHLPGLLQGEAAAWFRNNRQRWCDWKGFVTDFRLFYFPVSHQEVHPRQDTSRPDRVKMARALAKNSNDENLRHWKGRCHPGDCALNQDHTPPSGAEGSAVKRAPKPSGPYTIPKVLASVAPNPQPLSGPKTLRAQASDLRPYRVPEAPAHLVNVCRMPNQRASPAPTGMTSVRLQLRRRLSGQADLARAARQAARQLQERFRRSPRPRPPQEVATTQPPHCRRKTPTTPPPEAESTTPAPTTDQTLDLEWEIVDEVDAALAGMGSPAALPPARRTDPDSHTRTTRDRTCPGGVL
jgi:hypothetical protein